MKIVINVTNNSSNYQSRKHTYGQSSFRKNNNESETFHSILERHMEPLKAFGVVADRKAHIVTAMGDCVPLIEYAKCEYK